MGEIFKLVSLCLLVLPAFARAEMPHKDCHYSMITLAGADIHAPLPQGLRFDSELVRVTPDFLAQHSTGSYAHGGDRSRLVRDQGSLGSCWLNSGLSLLEYHAKKEFGTDVTFSDQYVLYGMLRQMGERYLKGEDSLQEVKIESSCISSGVIEPYRQGLVPTSIWQPILHLNDSDVNAKLFLTFYRHFLFELKRNKLATSEQKVNRIKEYLESHSGQMPNEFSFAGETFTPHSLYFRINRYGSVGRRTRSPQQALVEIVANIDAGHPVVVRMDWNRAYIDGEHGIASIEGVSGSKPHPDMWELSENGTHAVLVVDYELGPDGLVKKLLVQNSWGPNWGDRGYVHMYRDFFMTFYSGHMYGNPL